MTRRIRTVIFVVAVLSRIALGQVKADEPLKASICELAKEPERFNGKMVQVRATIFNGFEVSLLRDPNCAIWLNWGDRNRIGPALTPTKDREYQKMDEYLAKFYTNKKGQFCRSCPLYTVTVDATGRFEHVDKLKVLPEDRKYTGFGHFYGFESQLVLQSVNGVSAEPVDPSIYESAK
jgi:hypothetical protein